MGALVMTHPSSSCVPGGQDACFSPISWHGAAPNPTLLFRRSYCACTHRPPSCL